MSETTKISWNSFWELLCLIKSPFFIYVYILYVLFVYLFCVSWVCGWSHIQHSMEIRGQPVEILGIEFRSLSLAAEAVINGAILPAFIHLYPLYIVQGFIKTFSVRICILTLSPSLPAPASPLHFSGQFSSTFVSLCRIYMHDTIYTYMYVCSLDPHMWENVFVLQSSV